MNKIFSVLPFLSYQVLGNSMFPNFMPGQKVLVRKKWFFCNFKVKDVIILKDPRNKNPILKRIKKINDSSYFVLGDNKSGSTDSREFGWIKKYDIIGKVIYGVHPF